MGITLEANRTDACCLCGGTENLSGEHKVKASILRAEFGTDRMVIGVGKLPIDQMRPAQGPRSKEFHFAARVCGVCNNERTQAADREFDRLNAKARALFDAGADPVTVMDDERYAVGSEPYLNVFRYFAKLLCCHVAEVGGPRRRHVADFALGRVSENCVWLKIDKDWTYNRVAAEIGPYQYAAHGGLMIYADKQSGAPNAFHSTITVGPLQYVFFSRLTWIEMLELKWAHRPFYKWCQNKAVEAFNSPLSDEDHLIHGLADKADGIEPSP